MASSGRKKRSSAPGGAREQQAKPLGKAQQGQGKVARGGKGGLNVKGQQEEQVCIEDDDAKDLLDYSDDSDKVMLRVCERLQPQRTERPSSSSALSSAASDPSVPPLAIAYDALNPRFPPATPRLATGRWSTTTVPARPTTGSSRMTWCLYSSSKAPRGQMLHSRRRWEPRRSGGS